ncbi:MAG: FAD-dependent oxidoreductase, partial [Thermaerobacterales bacterium]
AIIATGPLTSETLTAAIEAFTGEEYLAFFDAAAPIVSYESLDHSKVFLASRYDKGEAAYLNCPMNEEEYDAFWNELVAADAVERHDFEKTLFLRAASRLRRWAAAGAIHCDTDR